MKDFCEEPYIEHVAEIRKNTKLSMEARLKQIKLAEEAVKARDNAPKQNIIRADVLCPMVLKHDATPVVYKRWLDEWATYAHSSRLDTYDEKGQYGFLKKVIDAELCALLMRQVTPITTVTKALEAIKKEMMRIHPDHTQTGMVNIQHGRRPTST